MELIRLHTPLNKLQTKESGPMFDVLRLPVLLFRRYYHALWLRVCLYALLSLVISLITFVLRRALPETLLGGVDADAVMPVLTILASSMLAVSTFSLNVMVSAHRAAASASTPRVHRLLLQDTTTQSVLSAFIGAFIFALTTIILFRAGFYGDEEAIVVLAITTVVVAIIIVAMLRWIGHLSHLGSLDNSLDVAANEVRRSLSATRRRPCIGATPLTPETVLPEETTPILAPRTGYLQLIDIAELASCAKSHGAVYVLKRPGQLVFKNTMIAQVAGTLPDSVRDKLSSAFVIGTDRTHELDPEFSLLTLSEIASKALSPGVNDPGTAIAVINRVTSLFWDALDQSVEAPKHPEVFMPAPGAEDLIEAAFAATARDGAGQIEVAEALRRNLLQLASSDDPHMARAATAMAARALAYAEEALTLEQTRDRLRALTRADQTFSTTTEPTE